MDLDTARRQTVLELRIHGIGNSPPHGMLDVAKDDVQMTQGDKFGSFWELTAPADARDRALRPGQLHHIPEDVRREAYSWGHMARAVLPSGSTTAARVWAATIRAMRAGVVPFGITNAAYWARQVPPIPAERAGQGSAPEPTAAMTRLFGLALTLLMVSAATTITVLMVGGECYAATAGASPLCREVPGTGFLGDMGHGGRAALLSIVPVLVIMAFVAAGRATQAQFDQRVSAARAARGGVGTQGPLLYRAGFWARRESGTFTLLAHLGAALAFVAALLSWTTTRLAVQTGVLTAAGVVIAAAATLTCLRTDDYGIEVDVPAWRARATIAVAAAGFLSWALAAVVSAAPRWFTARPLPSPQPVPTYIGITVAPSILGVALIGLASTGLVWRHARGNVAPLLWALVPMTTTATIAWVGLTAADPRPGARVRTLLLVGTTLVLALPAVVAVVRRIRRTHPYEGWNGSGPGIFMLLATGVGSAYSSLGVLGARSLLTRPGGAPPEVPSAFLEFAAVSFLIVLGVLVQLAIAMPAIRQSLTKNPPWIPGAHGTRGDLVGPTGWAYLDVGVGDWKTARHGATARRLDDRRPDGDRPGDGVNALAQRVQRDRQAAALAQRGELAVNAAAVACLVALLAAVLIGLDHESVAGIVLPPAASQVLMRVAGPSVTVIVAAMLASAVNGTTTRLTLAVDVLWDLMCFLPRSAHPLGPASYAERAVPEIRGRVDAWLHGTDLPGSTAAERAQRADVAARRRVVLSAHSMGCTLAVGAVLIRAGNPVPEYEVPATVHDPLREGDVVPETGAGPTTGDGLVGLLTYGSQVRAYFGRFFPSLFGPETLGTARCTGPAWRGDPWARQVEHPGPQAPAAVSLSTVLTDAAAAPAWVNLWRRTDVLGFPVDGYGPSDVDRGAEEVDRGSYLFRAPGHDVYWRALAYDRGFAEVVSRLRPSPAPGAAAALAVDPVEASRPGENRWPVVLGAIGAGLVAASRIRRPHRPAAPVAE
ncbi:MAG: hypothetical protein FWF90_18185 [Promicromonosporaceae bacterium]|nr:hypothetical protein [Promicromonosporaceae bacterium]